MTPHDQIREIFRARGWTEVEGLNRLEGIVSDHCLTLDDCAEVDLREALKRSDWRANG